MAPGNATTRRSSITTAIGPARREQNADLSTSGDTEWLPLAGSNWQWTDFFGPSDYLDSTATPPTAAPPTSDPLTLADTRSYGPGGRHDVASGGSLESPRQAHDELVGSIVLTTGRGSSRGSRAILTPAGAGTSRRGGRRDGTWRASLIGHSATCAEIDDQAGEIAETD